MYSAETADGDRWYLHGHPPYRTERLPDASAKGKTPVLFLAFIVSGPTPPVNVLDASEGCRVGEEEMAPRWPICARLTEPYIRHYWHLVGARSNAPCERTRLQSGPGDPECHASRPALARISRPSE